MLFRSHPKAASKKAKATTLKIHRYSPYKVFENEAANETELNPSNTRRSGVKQHSPPKKAVKGIILLRKDFSEEVKAVIDL